MTVQVLGIRHHSPACARLAAHLIETLQPGAVLIEGPSDFNHRIRELLLDHKLPIALYSYSNSGERPAQCWFPFLDYSPEWVALRAAHAGGADVRFIDLPHWQYRTLPDARRRVASVEKDERRSRYAESVAALCRRFACDGDHALWDHLFESLPPDAHGELRERLDFYFHELRGDDPGTEQDQAREASMSQWVAWMRHEADKRNDRRPILVVCGGWHKRPIETTWPTLDGSIQPETFAPSSEHAAGSYLVPHEYRQVDALGGYGAGMQSPLFYQWAWQEGLSSAGQRALKQIASRLRGKRVAVSTADLIALELTLQGLSRLRGHAVPLRADILDAVQSALVKEALDSPAPWVGDHLLTTQDHPLLREALLAITGEGGGRLHADTPLPPLLHDVDRELTSRGVQISRNRQDLVLDRRRDEDTPRSQLLWRLRILGVEGVQLKEIRAPNAARRLPEALRFEEHWSCTQDDRWFPNLIEAAAYGATLESAARARLVERVHEAQGRPATIAAGMLQAIRAGLLDMGEELAAQLAREIPTMHDHAEIAAAAHVLLDVVSAGFWGLDTTGLIGATLLVMADRILWLLDGCQGDRTVHAVGDVDAVRVFDGVLHLDSQAFDKRFCLETLARLAVSSTVPAAIRGAALAVAFVHEGLTPDRAAAREQLLAIARTVPPREALGDFLYGLFSCARGVATENDAIVRAIQAALDSMSVEDFLVALPRLRAAFAWFPPRERGALGALVAGVLGLSQAERHQLLQLKQGADAFIDARRIEGQALTWARELGIVT
ncbi:hypothetical protein GCM10011487_06370 [Steroidobacter agaridevorans]|uniref:4-aminobutyrate aminotransferase n=1 Tax=Steroidobacter agaridevorans TaxID=2695856 RepID=A0A829Y5Z4_9GAMM|nr:DUF5682 family protein [Steroidobacter agaridevorans]GFE78637.1 hypothetical protein GCM10011487_06370 [Steroidobacter agaridevorans]